MNNPGCIQQPHFLTSTQCFRHFTTKNCRLKVRQQPIHARLCSSKEKVDRRPIDPPPIVQIESGDGDDDFFQNPNIILFVSLISADIAQPEYIHPKCLTGTTVSSLFKLKDTDNSDGGFFVFPDVSVRLEGQFRLRFSLYEINGATVDYLSTTISDVFTVYAPKQFPGMSESTLLSRYFAEQGVRIRIRKENRVRTSFDSSTIARHKRKSERDSSPCLSQDSERTRRGFSPFPIASANSGLQPLHEVQRLSRNSVEFENRSWYSEAETVKPMVVNTTTEFNPCFPHDSNFYPPVNTASTPPPRRAGDGFAKLFNMYLQQRNIPHSKPTQHMRPPED
ncbi:hypothetical protein K7432_009968 [Basidiobolus ranarum]|uniref:Velvet domain-containing protein n=1 Tax=Basidiobolus ranarum TaxID=34480 RepID=A0ABR2WPE4_9FUNG